MSATLEYPAGIVGLASVTADLFDDSVADVAAAQSAIALAAGTHQTDVYSGAVTGLSGIYRVVIKLSGAEVDTLYVYMQTSGRCIARPTRAEAVADAPSSASVQAAARASKASLQWPCPIEIPAGRTHDIQLLLYDPSGQPAAIVGGAVVRFKLCAAPDDTTPLLDIDSVAALDGGSVISIVSRGTAGITPAQVQVRFAQDDTIDIEPGDEYFGELGIVDTSETAPPNAFKRAGYGAITINPSPGGDVGTS